MNNKNLTEIGIWCLEFGAWNLVLGIWCLEFGAWPTSAESFGG